MHLADVDGMIAAGTKPFDPIRLVRRQPRFIFIDAVCVDILARDNAVARRSADGALSEGPAECDATSG